MTLAPRPGSESTAGSALLMVWDGWNRLTRVYQDDGTGDGNARALVTDPGQGQTADKIVAEYQYDGRNFRIVKLVPHGGPAADPESWDRTDYYYNESWQVLEERFISETASPETPAPSPHIQWLWDVRYIDAAVCRWRDDNSDGDFADADEQLFYCNDANMNVTALVNTSGSVVERYVYDPYGKATVYSDDWATDITNNWAAGKKNEATYCGYRFDPETALHQVRWRYYQATLGQWTRRDPAGYRTGLNRFAYCLGQPLRYVDPFGLEDWDPRIIDLSQIFNAPVAVSPEVHRYYELLDEALVPVLNTQPLAPRTPGVNEAASPDSGRFTFQTGIMGSGVMTTSVGSVVSLHTTSVGEITVDAKRVDKWKERIRKGGRTTNFDWDLELVDFEVDFLVYVHVTYKLDIVLVGGPDTPGPDVDTTATMTIKQWTDLELSIPEGRLIGPTIAKGVANLNGNICRKTVYLKQRCCTKGLDSRGGVASVSNWDTYTTVHLYGQLEAWSNPEVLPPRAAICNVDGAERELAARLSVVNRKKTSMCNGGKLGMNGVLFVEGDTRRDLPAGSGAYERGVHKALDLYPGRYP